MHDAPVIGAGVMFCGNGTVFALLRVGDHVA
jgi:hypothetical protein